jgi:murein lipoprotein
MKKNFLIAGSVTATIFLAGCTTSDNSAMEATIQALSNQVDTLTNQVSALQSEQSTLQSEQSALNSDVQSVKMASEEASSEAMRANERINNIASSYTK